MKILELKNIVTKSSMNKLNGRMEETEEKNSEMEDGTTEID